MIVRWADGAQTIFDRLPVARPVIDDVAGVYPPSVDSALLCKHTLSALRDEPPGRSVIELCAGSGIASIYAALAGAEVTAVDDDPRAVAAVAANAAANGVAVDSVRGNVRSWTPKAPADLVVANPPYVPAPPGAVDGHAWNAGLRGRDVLDVIIDRAAETVRPGGVLLLVFSAVSGVEATLDRLRRKGFPEATVVDEVGLEFGPVMAGRAVWLADGGFIDRGQRTERLVVTRAVRPGTGAWSRSR